MDHNSVPIIPNLINKLVHKTPDRDSSSTQSSPGCLQEDSGPSDGSLNEAHSGDDSNYGNCGGQSVLPLETRDPIFMPQKFDLGPAFTFVNPPYSDATFAGILGPCGPSSVNRPMVSMGLPPRVPLFLDPTEEPVFVNPKQYNAILRRRQARAKLEAQNKLAKARKPYLHESRHRHAMNRARGSGGRFLNKKQQNSPPRAKQNNAGTPTNRYAAPVTSSANPIGSDITNVSTNASKPNQQECIGFSPKEFGTNWGNGSHYRAHIMAHENGIMRMGHGDMLFGNSSLAL